MVRWVKAAYTGFKTLFDVHCIDTCVDGTKVVGELLVLEQVRAVISEQLQYYRSQSVPHHELVFGKIQFNVFDEA